VGNNNESIHLNDGEFSLNASGVYFVEKQKRTLKVGIPLTIVLSVLITIGGIYRLGFNLTSVLILISANFLNYLLNYRFNYLRRKNLLSQLVTHLKVIDSTIFIELFNKEKYSFAIDKIVTDDPRILFTEYTRLKNRWSIKLDTDKDAWLIPEFYTELQSNI
jgi:hypothetical protein